MQLTTYTDYSIRVLVYLALKEGARVTVSEINQFYSVSRHHLVKVVHNLSVCGYVDTIRGKGGGLILSRPPESINLGEVVRHTEKNMNLVECFKYASTGCPLLPTCVFKEIVEQAQTRFLDVFSNYTLADIVKSHDIVNFQSKFPISMVPVQTQKSDFDIQHEANNNINNEMDELCRESSVFSEIHEKYASECTNVKLTKDNEQEYRGKLNCSALRKITKAQFN